MKEKKKKQIMTRAHSQLLLGRHKMSRWVQIKRGRDWDSCCGCMVRRGALPSRTEASDAYAGAGGRRMGTRVGSICADRPQE